MIEFLDKLREKPVRVRKQIAFLFSLCIVGIIFVIWLSVWYPDMRDNARIQARVSSAEPSPLSSFMSTVSNGVGSLSDNIDSFKKTSAELLNKPSHFTATGTPVTTEPEQ
ncbi:MAG: hypothetical protein QG589_140 [Patescibacteria group bacterium]|nr:hypothetical protein [Patescibacteria group bacterium]